MKLLNNIIAIVLIIEDRPRHLHLKRIHVIASIYYPLEQSNSLTLSSFLISQFMNDKWAPDFLSMLPRDVISQICQLQIFTNGVYGFGPSDHTISTNHLIKWYRFDQFKLLFIEQNNVVSVSLVRQIKSVFLFSNLCTEKNGRE